LPAAKAARGKYEVNKANDSRTSTLVFLKIQTCGAHMGVCNIRLINGINHQSTIFETLVNRFMDC
jgi:hypothetical protein